MKFCLSIIVAAIASTGVVAFSTSPAFVSRGAVVTQQSSNTRLCAEEPEDAEEEGGLDLDLGEMFDMYV